MQRPPAVVARGAQLAVFFAFVFALLSACTIQLVPRYDPSLVEGLNSANQKTLALFSAVSAGSPKDAFAEYADRYDDVIGTFDALKLQASARAVPPLAEKISDQLARVSVLAEVCRQEGGDATACVNSTPRTLQTIVADLSKMRDTHRDQGLAPDLVALFKNPYEASIELVLTVETALKRD